MPEQAVLGITSGLVLIEDDLRPALVVEPTGPVARPGTDGSGGDEFLQLLLEQGFRPAPYMNRLPEVLAGWSPDDERVATSRWSCSGMWSSRCHRR